MPELELLQKDIEQIKARNVRVEADKAWETSVTRKLMIAILTYAVIVIFFGAAGLPKPFISAIVPTMGFLLSTLSVGVVKRWWVRKNRSNL